jgi:biopolymer transport protein TolR
MTMKDNAFYHRKSRRSIAAINVVPYIDVMLVLLMIFMVTAPLLTRGIAVELPKTTANSTLQDKTEPIIVSVYQLGNYYLNISVSPEKVISAQDLGTTIAAKITTRKAGGLSVPQVLVKGDVNANYGKVINAMVLLKEYGIDNVGLVTEHVRNSS